MATTNRKIRGSAIHLDDDTIVFNPYPSEHALQNPPRRLVAISSHARLFASRSGHHVRFIVPRRRALPPLSVFIEELAHLYSSLAADRAAEHDFTND